MSYWHRIEEQERRQNQAARRWQRERQQRQAELASARAAKAQRRPKKAWTDYVED